MDLRERYSFDELANEAERLVIQELGRQLEETGNMAVADNEGLVLDMAAYALNRVPPMYRANLLGRIYADTLKERYGDEIRSAVASALRKIIDSR
ncbi:MAG: competence protein ComFB [Spirochaetaceae bacterium]|nr:MAG: competence protein ComFB [Spirochaetaceae bacterium]